MKYNELSKIILQELKTKLENHKGLSVFAKHRAKFEGWLKVEVCEILTKYFNNVIPEDRRIDITFDDWAIELKTLNTNIRYKNVINKQRPITENTKGVIKDIKQLRKKDFTNKAVLFITFPIERENANWQIQLKRITSELSEDIKFCQFNFDNNIATGVIYFGLV